MTDFGAQRYGEIAALCVDVKAIKRRMRIVLENGSQVEMRDNYLEQVQNLLHNSGPVDSNWLRCSFLETYFVPQQGGKLRVVLVDLDEHGSQSSPSACARARTTSNEQDAQESESLHLVLDQSSSMQNMQALAYDGAKELVEGLPSSASVRFTTFSTSVSIGQSVSRDDLVRILSSPPVASGSTALHDAIAQSINLAKREDGRVTVVIVTDGQDTCSKEVTREQVRACIQDFQRDSMHRVLFLGTNQDAVAAAQAFGIPVQAALTFGNEPQNVRAAFRAASENVTRMRKGDVGGFMQAERTMSVR